MSESSRTGVDAQEGKRGAWADIPVWLAFVFLLVTALSWAGSVVAGRAASAHVPPYAISFIRWFAAFLIYLPFGGPVLWRQRKLLFRHFPILCAFSLFGVVGFTVPYYVGLQYTTAVNATLMNSIGPIMILVLAFLMVGTRISFGQGVGICLALIGAATIVLRGNYAGIADVSINIGDALVLVSFFSWAVYTVMLKWRPEGMNELAFLVALCGLASLMMLPMYLWELGSGPRLRADAGQPPDHRLCRAVSVGGRLCVLEYRGQPAGDQPRQRVAIHDPGIRCRPFGVHPWRRRRLVSSGRHRVHLCRHLPRRRRAQERRALTAR